jgi:hypothetical protein
MKNDLLVPIEPDTTIRRPTDGPLVDGASDQRQIVVEAGWQEESRRRSLHSAGRADATDLREALVTASHHYADRTSGAAPYRPDVNTYDRLAEDTFLQDSAREAILIERVDRANAEVSRRRDALALLGVAESAPGFPILATLLGFAALTLPISIAVYPTIAALTPFSPGFLAVFGTGVLALFAAAMMSGVLVWGLLRSPEFDARAWTIISCVSGVAVALLSFHDLRLSLALGLFVIIAMGTLCTYASARAKAHTRWREHHEKRAPDAAAVTAADKHLRECKEELAACQQRMQAHRDLVRAREHAVLRAQKDSEAFVASGKLGNAIADSQVRAFVDGGPFAPPSKADLMRRAEAKS